MSDTMSLFATGVYDEGQRCAVCSSDEHATAQCWAGQALSLDLGDTGTDGPHPDPTERFVTGQNPTQQAIGDTQ